MNKKGKLILGTVQFGLNYGINNSSGQVTPEAVNQILDEAGNAGVRLIDTAYGYGNSEDVLGDSPALHNHQFRIISKYAKSNLSPIEQYKASLKRLKVEKLYAYMVHSFQTYKDNPEIWSDFNRLKRDGLVDRIGFSLYSPKELEFILDNNLEVNIIQVPYNILDRQFEEWFPVLKNKGIEVHTRSAFLQGLFFKDRNRFEGKVKQLSKYVSLIQDYCQEHLMGVQDLALGYVLSSRADGVLIGVDSLEQLRNNIQSAERDITSSDIDFIRSVVVEEKELLSPVNWN